MSNFPFPILSLFSIYTTFVPTQIQEQEQEQNDEEESIQQTDLEIESSKIQFYFSTNSISDSKERKARLMGTVMGMADFAR